MLISWIFGELKILTQNSRKMKKKLISTIIWLFIISVWIGIYKFISYKIGIYYSILAAKQLEDDSTYGKLQFHSTAIMITNVIFGVVILLIIFKIISILRNKNKVK